MRQKYEIIFSSDALSELFYAFPPGASPSITSTTRRMNAPVRRCSIPLLQAERRVSGFTPHKRPKVCQGVSMFSRPASSEASTPFSAPVRESGCQPSSSSPAPTRRASNASARGVHRASGRGADAAEASSFTASASSPSPPPFLHRGACACRPVRGSER